MPQEVLLVDGMALLFRHLYATSLHNQFMYNSKGIPTDGIQGLVRHIFSAIKEVEPAHVAVCWDMEQETFGNEMYDGYKQNHPVPPNELIPQFDYVKGISHQFGFVNVDERNYEADDIVGSLAEACSQEHEVCIVTGDRDLLQYINHNVEVWLIRKGFTIYQRYTLDRFADEYGLDPQQLVNTKAFMGDTVDGYSGVKGIGEKIAIKLIQNHGTIENVVGNLSSLTPVQRKKITNNLNHLHSSKSLAETYTKVPVEIDKPFEEMTYAHTLSGVLSICNEHELYVSSKYVATHL